MNRLLRILSAGFFLAAVATPFAQEEEPDPVAFDGLIVAGGWGRDFIADGGSVSDETAPRSGGAAKSGGGGYNSAVALRLAGPGRRVRFLNEGPADAGLEALLRTQGVEVRSLGLAPAAMSAVEIDALLGDAPAILVNGVASRAFLGPLATRWSGRMHAVLTPGLSGDFLFGTVLPNACAAYVGSRDTKEVLGVEARESPVAAVSALRAMTAFQSRGGQAFLTMGARGVLASGAGGACLVRLEAEAADLVALSLADQPYRAAGCGDAFAAGAFAAIERGEGNRPVSAAEAAIAGCVNAIRWMRLGIEVSDADFDVREVDLLGVGGIWRC